MGDATKRTWNLFAIQAHWITRPMKWRASTMEYYRTMAILLFNLLYKINLHKVQKNMDGIWVWGGNAMKERLLFHLLVYSFSTIVSLHITFTQCIHLNLFDVCDKSSNGWLPRGDYVLYTLQASRFMATSVMQDALGHITWSSTNAIPVRDFSTNAWDSFPLYSYYHISNNFDI